jgi:hypothetical protein
MNKHHKAALRAYRKREQRIAANFSASAIENRYPQWSRHHRHRFRTPWVRTGHRRSLDK